MRALFCALVPALLLVSCLDGGYGEDARCYANEDCTPAGGGGADAQVDLDTPPDAGTPDEDGGTDPTCGQGAGQVFTALQQVPAGAAQVRSASWAPQVQRLCFVAASGIQCGAGTPRDGGTEVSGLVDQPHLLPTAGTSAETPSLTSDGELIFYVEVDGQGDRHAYVARWDQDEGYGAGGRFQLPLQNAGPILDLDVSGDGTAVAFAQKDEQTGDADIYLAVRPFISNDFGPAMKLPFNTPDDELAPALSHDGKELLFSRPASSSAGGGYRFGHARACDGWTQVDDYDVPADPNGGSGPPDNPEWGDDGRIYFDHVGTDGVSRLFEALP